MGQKILIFTIMQNLRKRLKLILGITFLSVGVVWFLMQFILTPEYKATSQILVEKLTSISLPADMPLTEQDPQVADMYSIALRSPEVLGKVIKKLELDMNINELHEKITVSEAIDSQVLNITVTSYDKEEAAQIANTVALTFKEESPNIMQTKNVSVIPSITDQANASPFENSIVFSLGMAGAFGFIIGTLIAFIMEMMDTLFKSGRRESKDTATKLQTVFK
ncbi:Wzz/FepE/Etk N-terminal domain-containing protein [Planococcus liqunii]|uniref:Wzz/FepE/Etk N-terminal domain-containing protein n=1 Tax=Planococcus liqunii TaxID=3058394 RepID=A0ABT8MN01_9BACL|nr:MULTISPECIES: Wzz/FepE/Etk N-terminal domain-containing protein [unclassified Planococcus (in: firmicutes)]MDN7226239.1 Wzz/FepE/Etk N-terminal domain-containing protein [Planococcus sp. N064]WKA50017.1 Wzz/FepE/Etk N-terminal domain-containing protein [Planococcus sp. N056]